jgi:hypothetical protein
MNAFVLALLAFTLVVTAFISYLILPYTRWHHRRFPEQHGYFHRPMCRCCTEEYICDLTPRGDFAQHIGVLVQHHRRYCQHLVHGFATEFAGSDDDTIPIIHKGAFTDEALEFWEREDSGPPPPPAEPTELISTTGELPHGRHAKAE